MKLQKTRKAPRHDPLHVQLSEDSNLLARPARDKYAKRHRDDHQVSLPPFPFKCSRVHQPNRQLDEKMTLKIMQQAQSQLQEIADDEDMYVKTLVGTRD
jgi:hypothetical protein